MPSTPMLCYGEHARRECDAFAFQDLECCQKRDERAEDDEGWHCYFCGHEDSLAEGRAPHGRLRVIVCVMLAYAVGLRRAFFVYRLLNGVSVAGRPPSMISFGSPSMSGRK